MTPLLEQFLSEAREFLQGIGEKLMRLEDDPADADLMNELFRLVHTLKGNSGLFELPEMTRVLHAGEDLMDAVRQGRVAYSRTLADRLLDAMDFVGILCDEIEAGKNTGPSHASDSARLAESLHKLIVDPQAAGSARDPAIPAATDDSPGLPAAVVTTTGANLPLAEIPEAARLEAYRRAMDGDALHWLVYDPAEECFYQGDDPFFRARQTPGLLWGEVAAREPWPALAELDAYRCVLEFRILAAAPLAALEEHYRYVPDQIQIRPLSAECLGVEDGKVAEDAVGSRQTGLSPGITAHGLPPQMAQVLTDLIATQREILALPIEAAWHLGRIKATAAALSGCLRAIGAMDELPALEAATAKALGQSTGMPLLVWLDGRFPPPTGAEAAAETLPTPPTEAAPEPVPTVRAPAPEAEAEIKFGRRAEDNPATMKSLRVDQVKIDRLMNLIGEMVVAKNALPYLAGRAESVFGSRELAREIKAQHAVINRIAEEMQDAIMQVRMMPVSFVFQRFPRLVRDISRKLGKEVNLVLEGESTEADKNIVEALGDPLVHIVRNSLDHGFEMPEVRRAIGKPPVGTLILRASQESDRVVIEVVDDGQGIDPAVVKRKAYEQGVIDEATLERIGDQEAVNLIFAAGFSTAAAVSDLSGRGVGMDAVRTAVQKVNGSLHLDSEKGKGTRIRIALPLSMAVTNVMIVESDSQVFGISMDSVVETVRVPRRDIRMIKSSQAAVLRGRIVPIKSLNALLGLATPPKLSGDDELAVLVVRLGGEPIGLVVDDFRGTVDIILKPMAGVLAGLSAYTGSALMGDGTVLMVLDVKEIL